MLPHERIAAAFEFQPVDRVPVFHAGWSSWAASVVLGREAWVGGGIQQWREACALWEGPEAHEAFVQRSFDDAIAVSIAAGQDMIRPEYWRFPTKPTKRVDEYTFLYGDPDTNWQVRRFDPETELYQVVDESPRARRTREDLRKEVARLEAALSNDPPGPETFPAYVEAFERFGQEYAIAGAGIGLGIPYTQEWLIALVEEPDLVARRLDAAAELSCRNARAMAEIGLRFLRGGGDFAGKHGPMYSPSAFRELMVPRLRRISEACHSLGCYHMFASDGDLWPVADDLFGQTGIDAYYEIDLLAGMDLRKLREHFPRLTLVGGIASQTLHQGTAEDVRRQTLEALEAAKELRGIIVGVSNYPLPGTPPENILTMVKTIEDHREV